MPSLSPALQPQLTPQPDEPSLSVHTVALFSVALTLVYVLPFYLSPTTRPTPTLSRDAPSVIRARIRAVTGSCIIASLVVLWLATEEGNTSFAAAVMLLGWWPISVADIARCVLLTAVLFLGPLFERGIVEGEWRLWFRRNKLYESLSGWIGWRNYVAVIFIAPLYFGIAHIHHFYEFRLTHPDTPALMALLRSLFQFGYTTIFGWYATFLYLRTGSLWAVILVHSFCNWCGLPRFWGRVEPGEPLGPPLKRARQEAEVKAGIVMDDKLHVGWTVSYYTLLVLGALLFAKLLWPLTESYHALVTFNAAAKTASS
ncbi:CAAX amino terminal protease [Penicillium chermesinum]|uniref:intramembrane prenyl-peptidase Rce1 n=1 Tax=Penicillium chermesinum TaxID=63820 RepID=A0A9W9P5J5_9EURO|nr:CAAX amino terminal protease [Penicillium chermesinum]KAJ5238321.1 CAAX amino terminal protease [Penicillium chermesinum]